MVFFLASSFIYEPYSPLRGPVCLSLTGAVLVLISLTGYPFKKTFTLPGLERPVKAGSWGLLFKLVLDDLTLEQSLCLF